MRYDLDFCIRRVAGGQACALNLFKMMDALNLKVAWEDFKTKRLVIVEYVERLVYEGDE